MPTSIFPKLSDTQLVLLSRAAQSAEGRIALPDHLRGGAADKVMQSLLKHDLIAEERVLAPTDWSEEPNAPAYKITAHGLAAIGLGSDDALNGEAGGSEPFEPRQGPCGEASAGRVHCDAETSRAPSSLASAGERPNKQSVVLAMLRAEGGATVEALIEATGWQAHTIRAVISGFRKRGLNMNRAQDAAGVSRYRIVDLAETDAGDAASSSQAE